MTPSCYVRTRRPVGFQVDPCCASKCKDVCCFVLLSLVWFGVAVAVVVAVVVAVAVIVGVAMRIVAVAHTSSGHPFHILNLRVLGPVASKLLNRSYGQYCIV